jgi:hypothetical protein
MHRSKDVPIAAPQPQSTIDAITQSGATGVFARRHRSQSVPHVQY